MQGYFYTLIEDIEQQIHPDEMYLCNFIAENSDFVRFNHAKIRQLGSVDQRYLSIDLIYQQKHAQGTLSLSGNKRIDRERLQNLLNHLRSQFPYLPLDPYLLYATEVHSTASTTPNALHDPKEILGEILKTINGLDFVGHYAAGSLFMGFANALGQRNWHSSHSFNFDWSVYHAQDKAVKAAYAGFSWDNAALKRKIEQTVTQLEILKRPAYTIQPGQYRVYLSPMAMYEILMLLSEDSFGTQAHQTKSSALTRMVEFPDEYHLHPTIHLTENTEQSIAPTFQEYGFIKPERITLIEQGHYKTTLTGARSAKEYHLSPNANNSEMPLALDLASGGFSQTEILKALDTGVYINNLWYLNYSDRAACRITGMTRFATFWVEQGKIVAPLNVMRFDETVYRILGSNLITLTAEREFILDRDTYEQRSLNSARLPGALVEDFNFTL